jgi:predicted kinase
MNKLILTKGLPASGKTTWANEQVAGSNGKIININKDDLRAMLHAGKGSKYRESFVIEVQETLTKLAFEAGHDVIWSDTNLNPIHENRARTLSDCVEIVDHFLQVPIEDCISRDNLRANPVGEKAIRDQYNKWLRKEPELLVQDETKQKALIVDVDGTLAHMSGRSPFDWSRVGEDSVDDTVADVVRLHKAAGYDIIIVSGRDAVCRQNTEDWLTSHNIPFDYIYMRAQGDSRKDFIVKREIFDNYIRGHWNVRYVLDDRNSVVKTWREIGLKCFQVAEGDF